MTAHSSFVKRPCPACGTAGGDEEVASSPRAEALSLEALGKLWTGFHDDRVFFSYHRCRECGLLFAPEFFTDGQLVELYSNLPPNMHIVPLPAIEATQREYFDAAEKAGTLEGGYLEIGPDVGHVLKHAVARGRFDHFWLFEPNLAVHDQLAAAAGGHPHHVFADMDDLSPVPEQSIGLAVMIQVLDHLLDPLRMLEQIRATLRPGGHLLIVTHNEASLLRKVTGRNWPPFCIQHPALFNPDSIAGLLRRAGYSEVSVGRSASHFPLDFLVRQAGRAAGLDLARLPLPKAIVGLKLGNMITLAKR